MVGQVDPEQILPYTELFPKLIYHPKARVRWEATLAVSPIEGLEPELIEKHLVRLHEMIQKDKSNIARFCAIRAGASE